MKKILLMSLFVAGATIASAADSLIYWMAAAPEERDWAYAQLMYTTKGYNEGTSIDEADRDGTAGKSLASYANLTEYGPSITSEEQWSAYSFYVEYMAEGNSNPLFMSEILSYAQIKDSIKSSVTEMSVPLTTFNVPEPTSGMMLLLGMGLLALKRKKA